MRGRPFAVRVGLVLGLAVAAAGVLLLLPPIPQASIYHGFVDGRPLLGIPNFWNVASNLPILAVGLAGLVLLVRYLSPARPRLFLSRSERLPFVVLFLSIAFTGVGSMLYHWNPTNDTLVWDRLPLALTFMSVLSIIIAERIHAGTGAALCLPLLALGAWSVFYWHVTESRGQGDLRPYAWVQFYPLAAIPLAVLFFPPRYTRTADLLSAAGVYAVAKVFEALDGPIYGLGGWVSGHTIKHLLAAVSTVFILGMVVRRSPLVLTKSRRDFVNTAVHYPA